VAIGEDMVWRLYLCGGGGVDQLKKVYTKITAELGIMGDFCALADGA
jgi:hypothetical protein